MSFVASKMVKRIITDLDFSKALGPDFVPVMFLENCEPELLYILLAELFNLSLMESFFPDC